MIKLKQIKKKTISKTRLNEAKKFQERALKNVLKMHIGDYLLFLEKRSSFLKLLSDEDVGLVSVGPENSTKSEWFENLEWWLETLKPNRIFPVQPEIISITNIGHTQDWGRAGAVPATGRAGIGSAVTGQAKERNL